MQSVTFYISRSIVHGVIVNVKRNAKNSSDLYCKHMSQPDG